MALAEEEEAVEEVVEVEDGEVANHGRTCPQPLTEAVMGRWSIERLEARKSTSQRTETTIMTTMM